jgi:hypothetical protein
MEEEDRVEMIIVITYPKDGIYKVVVSSTNEKEEIATFFFDVQGAPARRCATPADFIPEKREIALLDVNLDPPQQFKWTERETITVTLKAEDDETPYLGSMIAVDSGDECISSKRDTGSGQILSRQFEVPVPGLYKIKGEILDKAGEVVTHFTQFWQVGKAEPDIPDTNIRATTWPVNFGFKPLTPQKNVAFVKDGIGVIKFLLNKVQCDIQWTVYETEDGDQRKLSEVPCCTAWAELIVKKDRERLENVIVANFPHNGVYKVEIWSLQQAEGDLLVSYFFKVEGAPAKKLKNPGDFIEQGRKFAPIRGFKVEPREQFVVLKQKKFEVKFTYEKRNAGDKLRPMLGPIMAVEGSRCRTMQLGVDSDLVVHNEYEVTTSGLYFLRGGLAKLEDMHGQAFSLRQGFTQYYRVTLE